MLDSEKNELLLLAWKGFDPAAAAFWKQVRADSGSTTCGAALNTGERVIAPDVETCDFMAGTEDLDFYRLSGVRAVQSTPLISRGGRVVGMISNHWREPHQPSERDLRLLDVLARQAADLIERKQAEEELRESEAHLSAIFARAEVGISEISLDGRFLRVNDTICRILNRTREELLGLGVPDVTLAEDLPNSLAGLQRLMETGKPISLDKRYVQPDGTLVWANSALSLLYNDFNQPRAILAVTADLTARKQAEEAERTRTRQLDLLARTSRQLIFSDKREAELLQSIFDEVAEAVETEFFFNFLADDDAKTLRLANSGGLSREQKDFFAIIRFSEHLCGTVARRRERLVAENLQECGYAEAEALCKEGVKCYAGFPLIAHGQLIGTVAFATCNREYFRPGELQMIQTVCDQVAITLERARSEEALRRARDELEIKVQERTARLLEANEALHTEVAERRRMEKSLMESEERYRTVFNQSSVGVYVFDKNYKIVECNERFIGIIQSSYDRIIGLDVRNLNDPACMRAVEKAYAGEASYHESWYEATTGSARLWLAVRYSPLRGENGNITGGMAIVEDITDRKRLEEERVKIDKMESVGTLAGGIAHDFNNLFTSILVTVSSTKMNMRPGTGAHENLMDVEKACLQAKKLTQQLLTFSSGGSPVRKLSSVEGLIKESAGFAARGSASRCEFDIEKNLWSVNIDEGQISQVIGNLVTHLTH